MNNTLITNIKQLLTFRGANGPRKGQELDNVEIIEDACLLIENGKIADFGKYNEIKKMPAVKNAKTIEANGVMLPGFCDSHTHPVFINSRLTDFSLRIKGFPYSEIKSSGGGILASIKDVRSATEEELTKAVLKNTDGFLRCGTTSIEAKSGYGLSLESEIKSLRAVKNAAEKSALEFVPTLLAAHSVPPEFETAKDYADYVIDKIIPQIAKEKLAVFCDVFCEKGFFNAELSEKILKAGLAHGLKSKIHAEQLSRIGGSELAANLGAVSTDHIDYINESDINLMAEKNIIATLLPACNHYLEIDKYPPVKKLIKAGAPIALATDFNPGSSPCWNMQFVLSLACIKLKMTPAQALTAATVNGAYAMGLGGRKGIIEQNLDADLSIFDVTDFREIAYYFGDNLCKTTFKKGKIVYQK